jgi:hypothetical protein
MFLYNYNTTLIQVNYPCFLRLFLRKRDNTDSKTQPSECSNETGFWFLQRAIDL